MHTQSVTVVVVIEDLLFLYHEAGNDPPLQYIVEF